MVRPPESADQQGFARAVVALLEALDIPYAIGGSVAAMEYGEPRLTIDIDLMVEAGRDRLAALVDAVEQWEIYVTPLEVILETGISHDMPFNIVDGATGTRADIYIVHGEGLSAEDVILFKLLYYRKGDMIAHKHPHDIAKIIAVMGSEIDVAYIEKWAHDLEVMDLWLALWDPEAS